MMQRESNSREVKLQQARDTGMAMVLICLLVMLALPRPWLLYLTIGLLVVNMTFPQLFMPVARLWFGLARLVGAVMSRMILTVIFFTVVTPIAIIRRLAGADALQLKKWRTSSSSVFTERQQTFTAVDLERPY